MMRKVVLGDVVKINPATKVTKGQLIKFISMDKLDPFTKTPNGYEKKKFSSGTKFTNGDTLLARITPCLENGKTAFVDFLDDLEVAAGSTEFVILRNIEGLTDPAYIYYLSISPAFRDYAIKSMVGTSGRQRVQNDVLAKMELNLPPLDQQKKIADILSSLDEKIELNRHMNETLEQLGQALFRYYFVDKAKQSNGNIQTIPLGKKFHPKRGRSLQARDMICGDTPVISGGLKPAGFHNEANTTTPVITISASGANAGFVSVWGESVWSADSSYIDSTITKYVYTYYLFLKNKQKEIYDMQTGSGQPHIYPKHIGLLEIADLSECEFNYFEQRVRPLFDMIHENKKQIDYLSNIRDLLLPKLISGGIKI